jgi:MerR HTH family regulatory protein
LPSHGLVADALEADWNAKLRTLTEAQEAYEQGRKADKRVLGEDQRGEILALATDFPRLWRDPNTPDLERKRMVRLLVEDVTLLKGEVITAHIRFTGGATQTLTLPRPLPAYMVRQTSVEAVQAIDDLLDRHTDAEIATILNERGLRSYADKPFHRLRVRKIRLSRGFQDRFSHLRARGLLTLDELAERLGVSTTTVKVWRRQGLLASHVYNDKGQRLYEPPTNTAPVKGKWKMTPRRTLRASPPRGAV